MKEYQKTLEKLSKRFDYNEENKRHFVKLEYLNKKDSTSQALLDFIHELGNEIGIDNSYEMTAEAIDVLDESINYSDHENELLDRISESVDGFVPIYYSEIGEWLKNNVVLVDEVKEELGTSGDTYKDTQQAYFITLENTTLKLLDLIKELS